MAGTWNEDKPGYETKP